MQPTPKIHRLSQLAVAASVVALLAAAVAVPASAKKPVKALGSGSTAITDSGSTTATDSGSTATTDSGSTATTDSGSTATTDTGPMIADGTNTDYSRFQIGPGVYPAYPPCLAWIEINAGGCGATLYFDCEGLFGPPAPCDDPNFWNEWS